MDKELQDEVKAAVDAAAAENPSAQPENVPASQAVKEPITEPVVEKVVDKAPVIEKDPEDVKKQVNNLNIALREEREANKAMKAEFEKKLAENSSIIDKFKGVFSPNQPESKPIDPVYVTQEDINRVVEEKLQSIKEEQTQNQKIEAIKQEIKTLETEWNGLDGKPQYNDEEVLQWQRDNEKVYLSPKDAFFQMRHNEILDWEVKQRLTNVKPVIDVEKPSSASRDENLKQVPNSEINTRDAIRQAMEDASKEM